MAPSNKALSRLYLMLEDAYDAMVNINEDIINSDAFELVLDESESTSLSVMEAYSDINGDIQAIIDMANEIQSKDKSTYVASDYSALDKSQKMQVILGVKSNNEKLNKMSISLSKLSDDVMATGRVEPFHKLLGVLGDSAQEFKSEAKYFHTRDKEFSYRQSQNEQALVM